MTSLWCHLWIYPGAHFTNNFSITIQMWWKFHFALILALIKWSLQNVAHGTTAGLSWHVPNFVAIWSTVIELELNEFSIEFELWWKNRKWNGSQVLIRKKDVRCVLIFHHFIDKSYFDTFALLIDIGPCAGARHPSTSRHANCIIVEIYSLRSSTLYAADSASFNQTLPFGDEHQFVLEKKSDNGSISCHKFSSDVFISIKVSFLCK